MSISPDQISLTLTCQSAAYQLLEDMRFLYEHPVIAQCADPSLRFLQLVNRKYTDQDADPPEVRNTIGGLHTRFLLGDDTALQRVRSEAIQLLSTYKPPVLPPPLWLRLLPICCSIAQDSDLFGRRGSPSLRWLAFNVDFQNIGTRSEGSSTVNINSHHTLDDIEIVPPANPLSKILYEYLQTHARSSMPYIFWGIRFRTTREEAASGAWLEIATDVDNGSVQRTSTFPGMLSAAMRMPGKPFPQTESAASHINDLVSRWAGIEHGSDLSSEEIRAYCQTLQQFYPQGKWPESGIDCFLCPSLLWSPNPDVLSASATIFWGFEGSLDHEQCCHLLWFSQMLLSGVGQFVNAEKTQERSVRRGRDDVLHQLPGEYGAVRAAFNTFRHQFETFLDHPDVEQAPVFPKAIDILGVTIMSLKAQNQRVLEVEPRDCAEMLLGRWSDTMIYNFVDQLVWPYVLERCLDDRKLKRKYLFNRARQLEEYKPQIKLSPQTFELLNKEEGIYPLVLYSLRNAVLHGVIYGLDRTLATNVLSRGEVLVCHECTKQNEPESVILRNTGIHPESDSADQQNGWIRDLRIYSGLTENWSVVPKGTQYSVYDEDQKTWVTHILWQRSQ